ncbi:MAG: OmpA family protein [Prevotella sp.]|nr:OmpA family protein [Prevotella sp.]
MKNFLMLLAFVSMSGATMAQEDIVPEEKYSVATNSFWSNWFVQANATWGAWYGVGQKSLVAPFHKFPTGGEKGYTGLGFSFALGKWFTPGIGLRTKVNAWRMGSKYELNNASIDPSEYWTANEHVLFNLSNLLLGYKESRVWNFIPYIGAGVMRDMTANRYSSDLSFGLLNTFRLSKSLAANLELGWNSYEGTGMGLKQRTQQFTLEVGLTYRLGVSKWNKTPDVDAMRAMSQGEIDALNAQLSDAEAENQRLRSMLASKPKTDTNAQATAVAPKTVMKVVSAPVSVFFNLGQSKPASKKDLQNVAELAKVAKDNDVKVVVTGYADSNTGSADYNRRLSEQRAEAVAAELVKLGIARDRIETVAAGGVDTLTPATYNRRATVELK